MENAKTKMVNVKSDAVPFVRNHHGHLTLKGLKYVLELMNNNDHEVRELDGCQTDNTRLEQDIMKNDKRITKEQLIRVLIMIQFSTDIIDHDTDDIENLSGNSGVCNHNEELLKCMKLRENFGELILDKEFHHHYLEASKRVQHDNLTSYLSSLERRIEVISMQISNNSRK